MLLCQRCWTHLRRGKARSHEKPPGLAICNNFAVVPPPLDIIEREPTWAELNICARAQVVVRYVVKGRHNSQIRSHSLVFLNHVSPALALPREVTPDEYFVMFANEHTRFFADRGAALRRFVVRSLNIRNM